MFSSVWRAWDRVLNVGGWIAAFVIIFMTLAISYEVIMRSFFNNPTSWVVNFTEYAIPYVVFLSVPLILAKERHVKINTLVESLSPRAQSILNTVTSVVGALSCGLLFWYGLQVTLDAFTANEQLVRGVVVPKGLITWVIPFGSLFLTIQFLRRAWLYAKKR